MSTQAAPVPATRYFQLQRANRVVAGIAFEPFDIIAGSLWGIHRSNDPGELAALDEALKDPKLGLSEINEEEYGKMAQKKTANSRHLTELRPKAPPVAESPVKSVAAKPESGIGGVIKGNGQAVVNETPPPKDEASAAPGVVPVAKVEEVLKLGEVKPSPTNPPRNSRKSVKDSDNPANEQAN